MLGEDRHQLQAPYGNHEMGMHYGRAILQRWGWPLDGLWALEDSMMKNLDPDEFGFKLWQGQLAAPKRILISDHVLDAVGEVTSSLIEVKLHLSEYRDLAARLDSKIKYRRTVSGWSVKHAETPAESVQASYLQLHLAGLMRALGSTLDCLAAVVVGVAGLPLDLRATSWHGMTRKLRNHDVRARRSLSLDTLVEDSGPEGWADWTIQMRNTWIHRPRPMMMSYIRPLGDSRRPRQVRYLPRTPDDSRVEAHLRVTGNDFPLIHEDAATTLSGVAISTLTVAQQLSLRLASLWEQRLEDDWITQPAKQWSSQPKKPSRFQGYKADDHIPRDRSAAIMLATTTGLRLRAAALMDDGRRLWRAHHL